MGSSIYNALVGHALTLNYVDPELYKDIQAIECEGDYGHKIQTLIRHLLYIQLEEEGAKSVVFSAWADSLFSK